MGTVLQISLRAPTHAFFGELFCMCSVFRHFPAGAGFAASQFAALVSGHIRPRAARRRAPSPGAPGPVSVAGRPGTRADGGPWRHDAVAAAGVTSWKMGGSPFFSSAPRFALRPCASIDGKLCLWSNTSGGIVLFWLSSIASMESLIPGSTGTSAAPSGTDLRRLCV